MILYAEHECPHLPISGLRPAVRTSRAAFQHHDRAASKEAAQASTFFADIL